MKSPLTFTDPEKTEAWFMSFAAKARSKGCKDIMATEGENALAQNLQITDLFLAVCGEEALVKLARLLKPRRLDNVPFKDIEKVALELVEPKQRLLIAERTNFLAIKLKPDESSDEVHLRINHSANRCEFKNFCGEQDNVEELKRWCLSIPSFIKKLGKNYWISYD